MHLDYPFHAPIFARRRHHDKATASSAGGNRLPFFCAAVGLSVYLLTLGPLFGIIKFLLWCLFPKSRLWFTRVNIARPQASTKSRAISCSQETTPNISRHEETAVEINEDCDSGTASSVYVHNGRRKDAHPTTSTTWCGGNYYGRSGRTVIYQRGLVADDQLLQVVIETPRVKNVAPILTDAEHICAQWDLGAAYSDVQDVEDELPEIRAHGEDDRANNEIIAVHMSYDTPFGIHFSLVEKGLLKTALFFMLPFIEANISVFGLSPTVVDEIAMSQRLYITGWKPLQASPNTLRYLEDYNLTAEEYSQLQTQGAICVEAQQQQFTIYRENRIPDDVVDLAKVVFLNPSREQADICAQYGIHVLYYDIGDSIFKRRLLQSSGCKLTRVASRWICWHSFCTTSSWRSTWS